MSMDPDPNKWVQNPPSVFVKVSGTSRDAINGKFGLVLQYAADRQRYTVLMCEPQDPVSLKADNLVVCGMIEKGQAYMQLMRNNPEVQRQLQRVVLQIQQRTGLSPTYAVTLAVAVIALGWYFVGFSKVLLIVTAIIMLLTVVGPDLSAGRDMRSIAQNAPSRWKEVIRNQVPYVGGRIAASNTLLGAFTVVLVGFFIYSLVITPAGRGPSAVDYSSSMPSSSVSHQRMLPSVSVTELRERFYKLGFDDATNTKEFGSSLHLVVEDEVSFVGMDGSTTSSASPDDPYAWRNTDASKRYDTTPFLEAAPKKKSPFNMATALAAFTLFRTFQPMAVNAAGQFDFALFRANLSTMEVWKMGLAAFSLYRIVVAFI